VIDNLPAPGRVMTEREPNQEREYHLYVPAHYHAEREWPLLVTCHGTRPWDTARRQLDTWKGLGERNGFLVVAPELVGTAAAVGRSVEEQLQRQQDDERTILSVVRAVRAARRVDERRIFLTGWSAGAYAVLFTGLRHPDVFRALSVYQGNFDPDYVEPCIPFLDRFQPVQIVYGSIDTLDNAEACIEWLRSHDLEPTVLERPGFHRRNEEPVYAFFADVVRMRPWIRIQVRDNPRDDMEITLSLKTSFPPVKVVWDFGDGERHVWQATNEASTPAAATHRYEAPGLYTVRAKLTPPKGKALIRAIQLQMPRVRLGVTPPQTSPAP
jgi:pimeloyl-ACP methyl ester carboxylesterase